MIRQICEYEGHCCHNSDNRTEFHALVALATVWLIYGCRYGAIFCGLLQICSHAAFDLTTFFLPESGSPKLCSFALKSETFSVCNLHSISSLTSAIAEDELVAASYCKSFVLKSWLHVAPHAHTCWLLILCVHFTKYANFHRKNFSTAKMIVDVNVALH